MKVKFLTSVAGLNFGYDCNRVYDLPAFEAEGAIQKGWAVSMETAQPSAPVETKKIEKAISKRAKEKR
jgi:hypothetical protein